MSGLSARTTMTERRMRMSELINSEIRGFQTIKKGVVCVHCVLNDELKRLNLVDVITKDIIATDGGYCPCDRCGESMG
jgi:hypothetical protein